MDEFEDYTQILSLGLPPIEGMVGPDQAPEFARVANDGLAELCAKYPDRFAGYVGALPMNAPDAAVKEAERILHPRQRQRAAASHQRQRRLPRRAALLSDLRGRGQVGQAGAAASGAHRRTFPDFPAETKSKYEIWAILGWPYETSATMARLIFSGRDHAAAEPEDPHPSPRRDDPVLRRAPRHRLGDARQPHLGRGLQRRAARCWASR